MTFTKSLKGSRVSGVLVVAIALTGLVLLPSSPPLLAQEVGATLFGTITDAAGASVPDASVTVTDPTTSKTVTATTQNNGGYVVTGLTPGTYTVTIEKTGFKKSVQTGIVLVVFQKARLDSRLEVGEISTTVEVAR